jgi:hypothetical protein
MGFASATIMGYKPKFSQALLAARCTTAACQ